MHHKVFVSHSPILQKIFGHGSKPIIYLQYGLNGTAISNSEQHMNRDLRMMAMVTGCLWYKFDKFAQVVGFNNYSFLSHNHRGIHVFSSFVVSEINFSQERNKHKHQNVYCFYTYVFASSDRQL